MTRTFSFLFASLFSLMLMAQEVSITYKAEGKNLTRVLKELERRYDLRFSYSVNELEGKIVSVDVENLSVETFLAELLSRHQLDFELVNERFVSVKKATSVFLELGVQDSETGETLPFATARIKGTDQGYIADIDGKFEVIVPNPDSTSLEISFLGYESFELKVSELDTKVPVQITLERGAEELQEVVIKEYLNKGITIDDQASRISIETQDMEILPGLSERDVLLSAQLLAGIGSADESAGGLNVRGSSRDNTLIYWNNIPVYQSAHYFGNISSFIPSAVGKVEIYKNYVPVSYGGASSGLVLINSRNPLAEKVIAEANINLTHGDAYVSTPFADYRGRLSIAARRSFNDLFLTPTFNSISDKLFEGSLTEDVQGISEEFEYNSKLVFNDLNVVVDYVPSSKDQLSASLLRSNSQLNYDSQDEDNTAQSIQEHNVQTFGANINWIRRWQDKLSTEFSASYADYHMDYSLNDIRNEEDETEDDLQGRVNNLNYFETRLTMTYAPAKNQAIDAGYQFNAVTSDLTINEDFFFEEDFTESIEGAGNTHGVFANYFGKYKSGIQLGAGLRFNHYESLKENSLDGQIRFNYELVPGLLLKSTAGVYHQFVSSLKEVDFVFSNTIEQNWITANEDEDIPVIRNQQVVVGALYTKGAWVIDLDLYRKNVLAPVARNFGPQPEEEDGVVTGEEQILGVDLTLKRRWKYYRAWASYSFQDSQVDAEGIQFVSGLNIQHQVQLSQTLNWRQFEFSLGYTLKSGLPFSQPQGFERFDEGDGEFFYDIIYEEINAERLPIYSRLDLSTWYKFKRVGKVPFQGEVGFSILNLLDTENSYSRTFSIDEDENERIFIERIDRRLIGLTPNVSVRLRF